MRFTVVWDQDALNQLAVLWANTEDRNAVADAVDRTDAKLRDQGDRLDEGFMLDDYIHTDGPIAVVFKRSFDDRMIRVTRLLKAIQSTP